MKVADVRKTLANEAYDAKDVRLHVRIGKYWTVATINDIVIGTGTIRVNAIVGEKEGLKE